MEPVTVEIQGRPAVRPLAAAAALALSGVAVLVTGSLMSWGPLAGVLGGLLVLLGGVLVLLSFRAAHSAGLTATLDDAGYRLTAAGTTHAGEWSGVRRVGMAGNSITVERTDGQRLAIGVPPGSRPEQLDRLADQFARRLDAARGYGRPW